MKKSLLLLVLAVLSVAAASAQFERGKAYVSASLNDLGISYSKADKFRIGLSAEGGSFLADNLLVKGTLAYDHRPHADDVRLGAGGRYYIVQNGLFLGTGLEFVHYTKSSNDLQIPVEIGYAFFLNGSLTLEPSVYYRMSTSAFGDKSQVGLRVGVGWYF